VYTIDARRNISREMVGVDKITSESFLSEGIIALPYQTRLEQGVRATKAP